MVEVPLESILARKSLLGAINLCIDLSGLDDADAMVRMRREGYEWREIASRFDVSVNTCRARVQSIAPDLLPMRRKAVKS